MFTAILILATVLGLVLFYVVGSRIYKPYLAKAHRAGYATVSEYLRATPHSEAEKKDAVDLALKGLVICLLGLLLPPLMLIGVVPLYYGARKIALASMGLGLFEDAEPRS